MEQDIINVFKQASPYVVNIHPASSFWSFMRPEQAYTGSGFIWNNDGYIVTNYHVVAGAKRYQITFAKGQSVNANVLGVDEKNDIAVLKLSSTRILKQLRLEQPMVHANSDTLQVGQLVIAIGNPYGLDQTLTTGVISALNRNVQSAEGVVNEGMIQTDASINPGNSGGPLLDSQGQVIGMNAMIVSQTGGYMGIAFSIPVNIIKRSVNQIIQYGQVFRPSIGVNTLSDEVAARADFPGVIIDSVDPGSPADRAGLKGLRRRDGRVVVGDAIVGLDGYRINNLHEYRHFMSQKQENDKVLVTYYRDGTIHKTTLIVESE